jgi:hypothetical protein
MRKSTRKVIDGDRRFMEEVGKGVSDPLVQVVVREFPQTP